jgi:hypothetical protein
MFGSWLFGGKSILSSGVSAPGAPPAWIDDLDPLTTKRFYSCVLTGGQDGMDDIRLPISSWQATIQSGRANYVQAVVPNALSYVDEITGRPNGDIVIFGGALMTNGDREEVELARAPLREPRFQIGPLRDTATLSGYRPRDDSDPVDTVRAMHGVRMVGFGGGGTRFRADVDWALRPGMKAIAQGMEIDVAYINFYVTPTEEYMDVGDRANG